MSVGCISNPADQKRERATEDEQKDKAEDTNVGFDFKIHVVPQQNLHHLDMTVAGCMVQWCITILWGACRPITTIVTTRPVTA